MEWFYQLACIYFLVLFWVNQGWKQISLFSYFCFIFVVSCQCGCDRSRDLLRRSYTFYMVLLWQNGNWFSLAMMLHAHSVIVHLMFSLHKLLWFDFLNKVVSCSSFYQLRRTRSNVFFKCHAFFSCSTEGIGQMSQVFQSCSVPLLCSLVHLWKTNGNKQCSMCCPLYLYLPVCIFWQICESVRRNTSVDHVC